MRNAVDAVDLEFLVGVIVFLGTKSVGWVGEVERAIRFVDEIVGTVEFLSLVGVGQDRNRPLWIERLQPVDVALRVSRDGQAAARVEAHAVRSRFGTAIRSRALAAAGLEKNADARARRPPADTVPGD